MRKLNIASISPPPIDSAAFYRINKIDYILKKNGHNVKNIYYSKNKSRLFINEYKNKDIIDINLFNVHLNSFKLFLNNNPDIVLGNTHYGAYCSLTAKILNIPIVFDMHGALIEEMKTIETKKNIKYFVRYLLNKMLDYLLINWASKIICVSEKMIQYLIDNKIPNNKLCYVPNCADLNIFKESKEEEISKLKEYFGISKSLIFGYAGGKQRWQGLEIFLDAAYSINDDRISFVIIGADYFKKDRNIIYIPRIKREELPKYYSICDVLVLPRPICLANHFASPTKFAEYLAMKRPILATNVGDSADLIKKYNCGIVISSCTPSAIKNGIYNFLDIPEDERIKMGANARKLAESDFSIDKMEERINKCLSDLIK
jgi:glycosyltransferase involved in cell wall biosynthesis